MKGTKKNRIGPTIVLGILALSALGAGMTWRNYSTDHPTALRARVIDPQTVEAEFSAQKSLLIQPGAKAIISQDGIRSTGYVTGAADPGAPTIFRLRLLQPFANAVPDASCQITIDLTLPPELPPGNNPP